MTFCNLFLACRPAAELASFWNKPLVTWLATDAELSDRDVYTTMARTLAPFSKMADFLIEVLVQFNWRRVVTIATTERLLWADASKAIKMVRSHYYTLTLRYRTQIPTRSTSHLVCNYPALLLHE